MSPQPSSSLPIGALGNYAALQSWSEKGITPVTRQLFSDCFLPKSPVSQLAARKRCTRKCRRNAVSGEQVEGSREPVQQLGDSQERRAALCGLWVRLVVCARKQKQTRTNRTRIVCQGSWRCQLFTSGFQGGHCLPEGHLSH